MAKRSARNTKHSVETHKTVIDTLYDEFAYQANRNFSELEKRHPEMGTIGKAAALEAAKEQIDSVHAAAQGLTGGDSEADTLAAILGIGGGLGLGLDDDDDADDADSPVL